MLTLSLNYLEKIALKNILQWRDSWRSQWKRPCGFKNQKFHLTYPEDSRDFRIVIPTNPNKPQPHLFALALPKGNTVLGYENTISSLMKPFLCEHACFYYSDRTNAVSYRNDSCTLNSRVKRVLFPHYL